MSLSIRSTFGAIVLLFCIRDSHAADWPNQTDGDVTLNDYACVSGDKFATLKLHYTTIGTPRRDAQGRVTNAVLLHGGSGKEYLQPDIADHLFKPGQVLDASRYYVVLPDGIGAGGSSKPSDGLHGKFPRYGYNDQVSTQQITLERLGVNHLKLVSGISRRNTRRSDGNPACSIRHFRRRFARAEIISGSRMPTTDRRAEACAEATSSTARGRSSAGRVCRRAKTRVCFGAGISVPAAEPERSL